jgi:hypothetical protein
VKPLAFLLAAAALAAAAAGARAETPAAFADEPALATMARESLWRALSERSRRTRRQVLRVSVRCYRDRASFERSFERRYGRSARRVVAYYAGGRNVHLRGTTCENVRLFALGRHTVFTAAAMSILLHEALHRQGLRNERVTTCFANEAVRWAAEWLGFGEERALRVRNLAFTYTLRYSPSSYRIGRPTCLALARRNDWTRFR